MSENKTFAEQVQEIKTTPKTDDIFKIEEPQAEQTPQETQPEPQPQVEQKEPTKSDPEANQSAKIRIGSNEFDSVEDAIKYAQDLEMAVLQQDAFNAGKSSAQPQAEEKPAIDPIKKKIADKLFENPEEAIEELTKVITEQAHRQIQETTQRAETIRKTWEGFYTKNQDLVDAKEIVEYVMQKNWKDIGHLPPEKGLSVLAEKTRSLISSYKHAQLPSKELPSNPAITTTTSNNATTKVPDKPKTALDFITQLNKHRSRTN